MIFNRPSSSLAVLLSAAIAIPTPVLSDPTTLMARPRSAEPFVQMAQKQDDENDKPHKNNKKNKGPPDDAKGGPPQGNKGQDKGSSGNARQEAIKQKQLQIQQSKEKALQRKQQADTARQDAAKKKQLEIQQAKDKSLQQKQQADKARQDAAKKKQLEIQQTKDKALQQKQEADKARQDATKKKQLEIQQAKDKALQQKQNADKAREDAAKKNQLEIQQAKDKALKEKQDAPKPRQDAITKEWLDQKQTKGKDEKTNRGGTVGRAGPPAKFDQKKIDAEFERAKDTARQQNRDGRSKDTEKWRDGSDVKFEKVRRERRERDLGSRKIIIEPDKRVIVREADRTFIRHDESRRLNRVGRELRRERRKNGMLMVVTMGLAGALIYTLQDDQGRVMRRSRKGPDGRELVLFDNSRYYNRYAGLGPRDGYYDDYVDVPPPVVRIPRDEYIVDYDRASPEELYETLNAPPIERIDRGYSLDEVRQSYNLLDRMRRVDLDAVNFEFGSWDVASDQYGKLERVARAMQRILDRAPDEVFLIEGHTDAVGSEIDNLSLSDRRAESVAVILSEEFGVPPENLTTQGYGEEHLKVFTDGPSRINRRVSVRRITPLLSRDDFDARR